MDICAGAMLKNSLQLFIFLNLNFSLSTCIPRECRDSVIRHLIWITENMKISTDLLPKYAWAYTLIKGACNFKDFTKPLKIIYGSRRSSN